MKAIMEAELGNGLKITCDGCDLPVVLAYLSPQRSRDPALGTFLAEVVRVAH